MLDITATLAPKSDQVNADDFVGRPATVTVEAVSQGSPEQPLNVHLREYPGRAFRPAKTVRRILAAAWGSDAEQWVGRRMTLYTDPEVTFGRDKTGGVRVSHLSHLDRQMSIPLTARRGKKQTYQIDPLPDSTPSHEVQPDWADLIAKAGGDEGTLRAMWTDAQQRGASQAVLDQIKNAATNNNNKES